MLVTLIYMVVVQPVRWHIEVHVKKNKNFSLTSNELKASVLERSYVFYIGF